MGARVVGVDSFGVDVRTEDGTATRLPARTTIWAAGVQASPLAAKLAEASGAEVDRAGRIAVLPDLSLPGHPEVFAVGDMAALNNLPGVAEVAMQGGLHAANTISRRLKGEPAVPFKYRDFGSVATLGRFRAVASVRKRRLSGFPAWVIWFFVHLTFLSGFGNRLSTVFRWLRTMIGRGRAERQFSTAHTGGDLSLPEEVKDFVQPNPFPVASEGMDAGG
jgi:NADH dehydrogenase